MIGTYNILAGNSTLMGGHKEKLQQISAQGNSLPAYAKLMEINDGECLSKLYTGTKIHYCVQKQGSLRKTWSSGIGNAQQ